MHVIVKKVKFYFSLMWKPVLVTVGLLTLSVVFLLTNLSTVPNGYSQPEIDYFTNIADGPMVPDNPIYLPIYLFHKLSLKVIRNDIQTLRIANAFLGLTSVIIMFNVIRVWRTTRAALLTCGLFITSTWFLIVTRSALPDVGVLLATSIAAIVVWFQSTKKHKFALIITVLTLGALLYLPGLIWFVVAGAIWKHKRIVYELRNSPLWYVIVSTIVFIIILIPLLIQIDNLEFTKQLTGITPANLDVRVILSNVSRFIVNTFWDSSFKNSYGMGSQAVFDIFTIILIITGAISLYKNRTRSRSRYILLSIIISAILIATSSSVPSIIILPYIMLIISGGIVWLLQQWLAVFPRNPFARNLGVVIVVIAVSLSAFYNSYRYFIAWPHMDSTKNNYSIMQ